MKNIPIAFENTYSQLPDSFFSKALPEKSSNPQLIAWNEELALRLGIDSNLLTDETKASIFSGNLIVEESVPLAMVYAGHQFGHFSPRLGDGRALLLGELVGSDGKRYDVQLKGSGRNTFSRGGDGRSPLGPVLREYLLSEAMHALGVSTSRALAAVETGDFIYRDSCLQSAVFTRVAVSLIRVGSFEYFAARGDKENLLILLKYATNRMFPEIKDKANLAYFFLSEVITRQAQLIAHWMSLGFIHGVMNTDNFSVAAITIDYGPCAFLDEFQFHKVFSSIDHQSRYSYANQPNIALWNLTKLAESLFILFETPKQETIQLIESSLQAFISIYERQWLDRMRK
ncbi:MAG: YdiU family protein, partial [Bdellovibrionales bacterium]|nr:YdiU family protein [Bdellovibrionales bacterium]